jgi:3-hydroxyisobutyrate dehydrogenase
MHTTVGFVGLGNMGSVLVANLVASGLDVVTHDHAGPGRSPEGATFLDSIAEVAARASIVVLSLPDGRASDAVAHALVDAPDRRVTHVVDTSTVGLETAHAIDAYLDERDVAYIDAPVSGGVAGARARTLSVIVAGPSAACDAVEPVLAGLSDRRYRVGDRPGMGQALKLANNFLSAVALAATSEAIAFGTSVGLDMTTMLEVLNSSSGQSAASSDKFVNHVLTGRYSSGFTNTLMSKDVQLYLRAGADRGAPATVGAVTGDIWQRFAATEPGVDFTRIYPFAAGA